MQAISFDSAWFVRMMMIQMCKQDVCVHKRGVQEIINHNFKTICGVDKSTYTNNPSCDASKLVPRVFSVIKMSAGVVACSRQLLGIAHFQKEWQTGERMGARSIMGSFGGTIARAKIFRSHKSP